jgi:hypothetical protein
MSGSSVQRDWLTETPKHPFEVRLRATALLGLYKIPTLYNYLRRFAGATNQFE